jgi:RNA polymerase sigma-70 factor (ECF subfamily)
MVLLRLSNAFVIARPGSRDHMCVRTQPFAARDVYMGVTRRAGLPVEPAAPEASADDGFGGWASPHLVDLWRFAVSLVGLDAADDLVQDSLARAWVKRDQFDPARGSARPWLFAIMADRARRGRARLPMSRMLDVRPLSEPGADEPETLRVDMRRAVDALPKRQRAAVTLHYYLDLPIADVAQLMGCSVGTVKSTLHDARRNLTDRLGGAYA